MDCDNHGFVSWKDRTEMNCNKCMKETVEFGGTKKRILRISPELAEEFLLQIKYIKKVFGEKVMWDFAKLISDKPTVGEITALSKKFKKFDLKKRSICENSTIKVAEEFVETCETLKEAFGYEVMWNFAKFLSDKPTSAEINEVAGVFCDSAAEIK